MSSEDAERKHLVANAAALYGLSRSTLYRGLRHQPRPKPLHRADRGRPKVAAAAEWERWCETIAAMKLRTLNGKGRHLSTAGAIRILEEHGVETPDGPVRLPPGLLSKPITGLAARVRTGRAWRSRWRWRAPATNSWSSASTGWTGPCRI